MKRKKPNRNVGNRPKSEVLHKETVVLHKEATKISTRRQPIYMRRQSFLHEETVQLGPPRGGT